MQAGSGDGVANTGSGAKAVGNYLGHASAATTLEMYVHETLNIKDSLRLYKKAVLMTTPSKEKKE